MHTARGTTKGVMLALLLVFAATGVSFSAAGGSQVVTIAAASNIDITVPAVASIGSTAPPDCGTTSTVVNVRSNRVYNLQIRSEPILYPNGKTTNGLIEMTNAFQYGTAGAGPWTNTTASYANIFGSSQPRTTGLGVDHTIWYRQCVDYADDPGNYTIVLEYLGVQP
ncbi:MAG: hypothetical protein ACRDF6_05485 [bacterium]